MLFSGIYCCVRKKVQAQVQLIAVAVAIEIAVAVGKRKVKNERLLSVIGNR